MFRKGLESSVSPIEAMIAIQRLEHLRTETIALDPSDVIASCSKIIRTVTDGEGNALFHYVNRLTYIEYLKHKYSLHKKRGTDVFRSRIRKS